MRHRYYNTDKSLAGFIRTILVLDQQAEANAGELPLFTNGVPAFVCRIKGDRHQSILFGNSILPDQLLDDHTTVIVFFFQPFVLGPAFRLSARQLKAAPVELDLWNAQKTIALNLQLVHAHSVEEKIATLQRFILSQVQLNSHECRVIQQATDSLLQNPDAEILGTLHKTFHLTERTFQRLFKKYVGIAPNEYRRICQFQMAFFRLKGGHYTKLADIAYSHGYFDQSHYIRSFKEFVHATPNEYLQFGLRRP
jgi:AraC-like DNA-binding protein